MKFYWHVHQRIISLANGTAVRNGSCSTSKSRLYFATHSPLMGRRHLFSRRMESPSFPASASQVRGYHHTQTEPWKAAWSLQSVEAPYDRKSLEAFPSALEYLSSYLESPSSTYKLSPLASPSPQCLIGSTRLVCFMVSSKNLILPLVGRALRC